MVMGQHFHAIAVRVDTVTADAGAALGLPLFEHLTHPMAVDRLAENSRRFCK
jgi:hypothetical protein